MIDHLHCKLGKRPRRRDARTLKMARYLTSALPAAPASVDYTRGITDFGMMLNDRLGCCTIAAVGHAVQVWTRNALGRELTVPDADILNYYEKWDGYNPADPATDQGGVELDVLNNWRQQGFDGEALDAFVAISEGNCGNPIPEIATAIWLFGGAYIGVELPISAQDQDVWDVTDGPDAEPGSWGGHAVYLVGYHMVPRGLPIAAGRLSIEKPHASGLPAGHCGLSRVKQSVSLRLAARNDPAAIPDSQSSIDHRQSTILCITWGQPRKMTWAFFEKYCSEAYALVSHAWIETSGLAPSGFDLAALEKDLEQVSGATEKVSGARCQVSGT